MARGQGNDCNAKDGNPFGPFWDTFNVDFVHSEFYGPLNYDIHHQDMARKWNNRYPSKKFPGNLTSAHNTSYSISIYCFSLCALVLAFTGAPASFPVQQENRDLHKYLVWSDRVTSRAVDFIRNVLPIGSFIGVHLRNGVDWVY